MIAALFVQEGGVYYGLPDVDPWPASRDARLYDGPWPVVAHPPCARWCRLAGQVESRGGPRRGADGGCFEAALDAVRMFGGVLEHPAHSDAWAAYGLVPPCGSGWTMADFSGGWCCEVDQGNYGHACRKPTWLFAQGVDLPRLRWGRSSGHGMACEDLAERGAPANGVTRRGEVALLSKKQRAATPLEFRDVLLDIARSVQGVA